MKIVLQPEVSVDLPYVQVLAVKDHMADRKIIARVKGIPRGIVLWSSEEYDSPQAQHWTNEMVQARAIEVLQRKIVPFE